MTDIAPNTILDDVVTSFQIEGWPVRGRLVRLGEAVDTIIKAHDYPEPVAALLGRGLRARGPGRLQPEVRRPADRPGPGRRSGPLCRRRLRHLGDLRGYCRFDEAEVAAASTGFARPGAKTLLGKGVFIMTLDQGPDFERHQGITPIEGESLSLCAEHYFAQSEQMPTKVRLAVGQVSTDAGTAWRAGGAMIQMDRWRRRRVVRPKRSGTAVRALFQTTGRRRADRSDGDAGDPAVPPVPRGRRAAGATAGPVGPLPLLGRAHRRASSGRSRPRSAKA
jgi:molecular chaperone Hsp33